MAARPPTRSKGATMDEPAREERHVVVITTECCPLLDFWENRVTTDRNANLTSCHASLRLRLVLVEGLGVFETRGWAQQSELSRVLML